MPHYKNIFPFTKNNLYFYVMCKKLVDYRCKRLDKKGDICDRKLFEATDLQGVIHIQCPKCGKMNQILPRKANTATDKFTVAHNVNN